MEEQQVDPVGHGWEHSPDQAAHHAGHDAGEPAVDLIGERTGLAPVDQVLEQVAALDDRPVDEHVAVFERAHEQLRRALDARPDA